MHESREGFCRSGRGMVIPLQRGTEDQKKAREPVLDRTGDPRCAKHQSAQQCQVHIPWVLSLASTVFFSCAASSLLLPVLRLCSSRVLLLRLCVLSSSSSSSDFSSFFLLLLSILYRLTGRKTRTYLLYLPSIFFLPSFLPSFLPPSLPPPPIPPPSPPSSS